MISDVGECDGSLEGVTVVTVVGLTVEGLAVGLVDELTLGSLEGLLDGRIVGFLVGDSDALVVVGLLVGM